MCYWVKSCGLPQDGHARHTNSTVRLDCAYRVKSMFARSKTTAPSWPKVVRPVANDKDVATRDRSHGLLLASLHCSKTDDIMELLL